MDITKSFLSLSSEEPWDKDATMSPTTKKPTKLKELVLCEALGEEVSLLFISANLLQNKWMFTFLGWIFIETIPHKVAFDSNVFGAWGQTWCLGSGNASIVVFKDLGFDNGVRLSKIKD